MADMQDDRPVSSEQPGPDEPAAAVAAQQPEPGAEPEPETETVDAAESALPKGSIAAVGERLGQRVAHVGEAAGDKLAHAGEVAGERMTHASETAGGRTVADAQTRAAQAKRRIGEQAGELAERVRRSAPAGVRERGARAVQAVRKHRRAIAGSAVMGLVAVRRRTKNGDSGDSH
jgi:hypothetical protein